MTKKSNIDRFKYYSKYDYSINYYIKRIEHVICNFDENKRNININDIIELYNVNTFLKNNIYDIVLSGCQIEKNVKKFNSIIGRYFSKINNSKLGKEIKYIDDKYIGDLLVIVEKYDFCNKIDKNIFIHEILEKSVDLSDILKCKKIVEHFSKEITAFMRSNPNSIEALLDYAMNKEDKKKLYLPSELSEEKKLALLEEYIDSDFPYPKYLYFIVISTKPMDLNIPDSLRLKAKQKYDKIYNASTTLKDKNIPQHDINVRFSDDLGNKILEKNIKVDHMSIIYNAEWIRKNLDYPTLLNNFIYLFNYVDYQFRSMHNSKESNLSIIEKNLLYKIKGTYKTGVVFHVNQILAKLQMEIYHMELKKYNIFLEDIIEWFFNEYLKKEFNIEGFNFNKSHEGSSYREKFRNVAPEIESILRQFKLYCENNVIDWELLRISRKTIRINEVPSMLKNKYIYPNGDICHNIMDLLFSHNSILSKTTSEKNISFYKLMLLKDISYNAFDDTQRKYIDELVNYGIIKINDCKKLEGNLKKIDILNDLYKNDVSCYHYLDDYASEIFELNNKNLIKISSSLFSLPEQEYYNFLLNRFDSENGSEIRNKYLHGTNENDNERNKNDYFVLLRIMILIIIKINEEFCLQSSLKNDIV